ncbi:hypothetical protein SBOR_1634 [Sclerotinia borealis F-4128]|uniref:AB hydrolase-1 domain-containing protein n=1 Tax=Sclerotinia borealis (strain F-4128) TaxID=1432307 RepID=W9CPJ9_SCLBF|nr:hypothetical protein SBOR_1634 [Sclerotinia borealis F-4128]
MTPPTIIFIHGAWHDTSNFSPVIGILEPLGYPCITIAMPSTGGTIPTTDLTNDIAAIRHVVLKEVDAGKEVIVCSHSWGGIPTTNALDGLSISERSESGKVGGVVKIAFLCAFVVPVGTSLQDATGGMSYDGIAEDGFIPATHFGQKFYHDLDDAMASDLESKLKLQSVASFQTKATSAAHLVIPSIYLICEDDQIIPMFLQELMIADARKAGGIMEEERVFCGHSPFFKNPEFTASFLRRAAGENV